MHRRFIAVLFEVHNIIFHTASQICPPKAVPRWAYCYMVFYLSVKFVSVGLSSGALLFVNELSVNSSDYTLTFGS